MPRLSSSITTTGLTITNPLILYRTLLATKQIDPDPAQYRLALHLQKLYFRLKDYSPASEYGARLKAISKTVAAKDEDEDGKQVRAVKTHPLRGNPLFAHLFLKKDRADSLALTRVLTSHEAAMNLDSPRGLLLHGEVGTGKSMLVDLLADSLPNKRKRRWHFNTFMLETLARLEQLRRERSVNAGDEEEYALLWLAKDMIEKSPILFLDEFQLPDRAASKILSILLTTFFQLGGVLIASSNRIPDELAKASGVDYAAQKRGGLVRNWLGLRGRRGKLDVFPGAGNAEYVSFVEVLKSRCETWDIEGGRDWRRREVEQDVESEQLIETMREEMAEGFAGVEKSEPGRLGLGYEQSLLDTAEIQTEDGDAIKTVTPKMYLLSSSHAESTWSNAVLVALPSDTPDPIPWESTTLLVYGRQVPVPRHLAGVTYWTFSDLCGGTFGPADYITLASTFHTLILDEVPVLTLLQKNEARRLITLLDALYEARCKLIVRADVGPDELFFPETSIPCTNTSTTPSQPKENDGTDAVYPETLSEIYQDQTSPFRPNISSYSDRSQRTEYDPDEDSGFAQSMPGQSNEIGRQVDFGMTSSFTGEDERFAYKRAGSRLWEMCGARWHARAEAGWWRPLPLEARRWEGSSSEEVAKGEGKGTDVVQDDVKLGDSFELDSPAGLQGKETEEMEKLVRSPFRQKAAEPPQLGGWHAWGMTAWGKKAGAWGKGPEGLDLRKDGESG